MSNCANTLVINRPTPNGMMSKICNSSACSTAGGTRCANIGPRPNREKVRQEIRYYILNMLGAPKVDIELDEQNIDFCIDQALSIIEDYAGREYYSYYVFLTVPGKSVYEMPPDIGIVRNVFYKETANFAFQTSDLDGAIPIEYFYPGGAYASIQGGLIDPVQPMWGRIGEWTLYKQYENMYSRLASNIGGWEWISDLRHIKLYPIPYRAQRVIVHYMQKCKDWTEVTQAMKEGALTYAKEILGRVRGKYKNPPGPGGGIQNDGDQLLQEAKEERQKWFEDLIYKFGDIPPITIG